MLFVDYERRDGKVLFGRGLGMGRGIEFDMAFGLGYMKEMISLSFRTFRRTECCLRVVKKLWDIVKSFFAKGYLCIKKQKVRFRKSVLN